MRYMGLDLGNRTCGVAVSDIMGVIATGVGNVIANSCLTAFYNDEGGSKRPTFIYSTC